MGDEGAGVGESWTGDAEGVGWGMGGEARDWRIGKWRNGDEETGDCRMLDGEKKQGVVGWNGGGMGGMGCKMLSRGINVVADMVEGCLWWKGGAGYRDV